MRFGGGGRRFDSNRRFGDDRRFDRRPNDLPKPLKVGEEYDVEIKEVGSKGDGIARVSNFVVFVNGAKMGEKLHIKITDVRDRFAIAEKAGEGSVKADEPVKAESESTEEVKETSSDDLDDDNEDESAEDENEQDE